MVDPMKKINRFDKEYSFLSNFYSSPIWDDGIVYPTVEHYFQAMKTLDPNQRRTISMAATPGIAKRMGRKVQLRKDWEQVKEHYMLFALRQKFLDPTLKERLLATGDTYLEEGNTWHDTYWGVCNGVGENRLGYLLMQVREERNDGK